MSDKKIIIRNCPNITFIDFWREDKQSSYCKLKHCSCENYTDCVMKKIVEKCREAQEIMDKEQYYEDDFDTFNGESIMAERVMDILDIEECE